MQTPASISRRAYQCVRCQAMGVSTIDRKDRLVHHVLKYHVPLDEAPCYCRLCMFRCMQESQLNAHVSNYQKHVKASRDLGILDHRPYLCKSTKPKVMTEADIMMLSKEESRLWFGQRKRASNFSADDAVWGSDSEPEFTATRLTPQAAYNHEKQKPAVATQVQAQTIGLGQTSLAQPCYSLGAVPKPTRDLQFDPQPAPSMDMPSLGSFIWSPTMAATAPALTAEMPVIPTSRMVPKQAAAPMLNTPLLDENQTSEDLLTQLLPPEDVEDPLIVEGSSMDQLQGKERKRSQAREDSPESHKRTRGEEPCAKETSSVDLTPVVKAFTEASAAIVEAIDRNSRAIRCQGATLESMVKELREVNHLLRAQQRSAISSSVRKRSPSPVLKSVVHRPRK